MPLSQLLEKDRAISARLCIAEHPGVLRALIALLTHSGDGAVALVGLGLLFALGPSEWHSRALALLGADIVTFVIVQLAKLIIRRARPSGEWGRFYRRLDPHSFPSGHAARGGALAAVGMALGPPWFGGLLAIWGLLVALSRVLLGVHYLSDAIAGFLIGLGIGGLASATFLLVA